MSTHEVPVVEVKLETHPNADSLSLVRIFGWTCCVRSADWKNGDLAAYVPPDYVVPSDRPEFEFLKGHERIRVRRFRGILSQGLLVPAPAGSKPGDNVIEALGIHRYEPPEPSSTGGDAEKGPEGYRPVYDVESWQRYAHILIPGEPVVVTEKIHGANSRYTFQDGRMYCGSRNQWKREDPSNLWWRALAKNPWIEAFCRSSPGWTLYGEIFGNVQSLKYGAGPNNVFFRAFDVWTGNEWSSDFYRWSFVANLNGKFGRLESAPILFEGPYDPATVAAFAEGNSTIEGANHIREGCVVRPRFERIDPEIGRVQLKIVSNAYLEKAQ